MKLYQEIIEDFNRYNHDLRKVKIVNSKGATININRLEMGDFYTLSYVFGEYHPILRDLHSGNRDTNDKRVKISTIPFTFIFRKDSLEKAFNISRVQLPSISCYTETNGENKYRETRTEVHMTLEEARHLYNYFLKRFNEIYPELRESKTKSSMDIRDIEQGIPPILEFLSIKNHQGKFHTVPIRYGENKKSIIAEVINLTEDEYSEYSKRKRETLYKKSGS